MEALELLIGSFTLEDLAKRSNKTVAEIVAFAMDVPALVEAATPKSKPKTPKVEKTSDVDTRTPAGREAYDVAVLDFLKADEGQWKKASEVLDSVGGTVLQVRTSLNRLIEAGSVEYGGKARGTKYRAM